ncbi:23S rRNA (guanosine(2251)-2'-O)-methyltransferase RlmB [Clostridium sp.]|uniref:23S rRNA (guanosine(2251)-2'-O)-methyltransferase RlmB n=1 Tax=Clostridium sp. TaxID=1506 RepID=UPI0039915224
MTKSENKMRQMRKFQKEQEAYERRARYEARKQAREDAMQQQYKNDGIVEKVSNREDLVEGRNAVIELLKSDRTVEQIFIASGKIEGSIKKIIALAKEKDVVLKEVDRKKLDFMSETGAHQGVIAQITPFKYSSVDDILNYAKEKGEKPFIVILDELEDPHNLGSIVRTAELSGVHGIIIPKRRNVGVTGTVYKASVGAIEYMKIAKVTNINAELDRLKEEGIWIYGADINGEDYSYNTDFSGACALIIGNEGKGMSPLTKKKCDKLVKIPMIGKINSLNASVAGGIMMYEILKSRIIK